MHIAYFGSPVLSAKLLRNLLDQYQLPISFIATQQDKPVGHHLKVEPTPVKIVGLEHDIDVFDEPLNSVNSKRLRQELSGRAIDLCIVFAYGKILSQDLLSQVKHGFWNVHPSLLPRYRGPTPTVFPIILGDVATGTTLIQMNAQMDEGDILAQNEIQINPNELREDIEERLIMLAGEQIQTSLESLSSGILTPRPQHHAHATYTPLLSREDGFIEEVFIQKALCNKQISENELPGIFQRYFAKNNIHVKQTRSSRSTLQSLFRALMPWPGLWTSVQIAGKIKRLKLLKISFEDKEGSPFIQTVQLEGKKPVEFNVFCKAYNYFQQK